MYRSWITNPAIKKVEDHKTTFYVSSDSTSKKTNFSLLTNKAKRF